MALVTKLARPKPANSKPAPVPTDANPHTDEIEFLGVGTDETEKLRFLKVAVGDKSALLSVRQLVLHQKSELARLEELGVPLILPAAQAEFFKRAHDEAGKPPTLRVATKVGLRDYVFVFPDRVAPPKPPMSSCISTSATTTSIASTIAPAPSRAGKNYSPSVAEIPV